VKSEGLLSLYLVLCPVTAVHILLPHILKVDKSNNLPSKHWTSMWSLMKQSDKTLYSSMCIALYTLSVHPKVPRSDYVTQIIPVNSRSF